VVSLQVLGSVIWSCSFDVCAWRIPFSALASSSWLSPTEDLKSSNPKGPVLRRRRTGAAGARGVWGEFRPPYKLRAKSVRVSSNAHRRAGP
jgi:hypothetical protein